MMDTGQLPEKGQDKVETGSIQRTIGFFGSKFNDYRQSNDG